MLSSSPSNSVQVLEITEEQQGQRIDNFLQRVLKGLPRSRLYRIIRKGEVRVNKKRIKPEYKLKAGDLVRIPPVKLDQQAQSEPGIPDDVSQDLLSRIIYENDAIVVLDKPAGLAVHSGSGVRFGVIDVMRQLRPEVNLELVHRLDRDTSGCLLLAKSRTSLLEMQRALKQNALRKNYQAVVHGFWDKTIREINTPLLKQTMANGERRVYVDSRGQEALTRLQSVQHLKVRGVALSVLDIRLMTGRTHQIRVHCQSKAHSIVGDDKYGNREQDKLLRKLGVRRMMLHASSLEIPRTDHTQEQTVIAPLPQAFRDLIEG